MAGSRFGGGGPPPIRPARFLGGAPAVAFDPMLPSTCRQRCSFSGALVPRRWLPRQRSPPSLSRFHTPQGMTACFLDWQHPLHPLRDSAGDDRTLGCTGPRSEARIPASNRARKGERVMPGVRYAARTTTIDNEEVDDAG